MEDLYLKFKEIGKQNEGIYILTTGDHPDYYPDLEDFIKNNLDEVSSEELIKLQYKGDRMSVIEYVEEELGEDYDIFYLYYDYKKNEFDEYDRVAIRDDDSDVEMDEYDGVDDD